MPPPNLGQAQDIALALLGQQLNRIKKAERPDLSQEQRRNLIDSMASRLMAGDDRKNVASQLAPVLTSTYAEQQTTAATKRTAAMGQPISISKQQTAPVRAAGIPASAPSPSGAPTPGAPNKFPPSKVMAALVQSAAGNPPKLTDPGIAGDMAKYKAELANWQSELVDNSKMLQQMQNLELGVAQLPDGTMIDTSDPAIGRDPALQAQVAAVFANQDAEVMNKYYDVLNSYDLKEYAGQSAATNANNSAMSQSFQNALSALQAKVSIGEANQGTAVKQIDRQISGMQESRARAAQTESELSAAQGLAGPAGKTSYGTADFGAAGAAAARYAGLPAGPNASVINFTGQRTVDPQGLMAQGDTALGVGGQLATIPELGVSASEVPNAPQMAMVGAGPTLRRPTAPIIPNRNVPPPPANSNVPPWAMTG